jgi:ABC-type methionine transport system ATPase subunit
MPLIVDDIQEQIQTHLPIGQNSRISIVRSCAVAPVIISDVFGTDTRTSKQVLKPDAV